MDPMRTIGGKGLGVVAITSLAALAGTSGCGSSARSAASATRSAALLDAIPSSVNARVAVHVDVDRLATLGAMDAMLGVAASQPDGKILAQFESTCHANVAAFFHEVVLVAGDDDGLLAASLAVPDDEAERCFSALEAADKGGAPGRKHVVKDGIVRLGSADWVDASLKAGDRAPITRSIELGADRFLVLHGDTPDAKNVDLQGSSDAKRLELVASFDAPSEAKAEEMTSALRLLGSLYGASGKDDLVLDAKRNGVNASIRITIAGSPEKQASMVRELLKKGGGSRRASAGDGDPPAARASFGRSQSASGASPDIEKIALGAPVLPKPSAPSWLDQAPALDEIALGTDEARLARRASDRRELDDGVAMLRAKSPQILNLPATSVDYEVKNGRVSRVTAVADGAGCEAIVAKVKDAFGPPDAHGDGGPNAEVHRWAGKYAHLAFVVVNDAATGAPRSCGGVLGVDVPTGRGWKMPDGSAVAGPSLRPPARKIAPPPGKPPRPRPRH